MTKHAASPVLALAAVALCLCLSACGDPVKIVREAHIAPDPSLSVGEAVDRYPFFTHVTWSSGKDKDGRVVVEADCDLDVASACRKYSPEMLALATDGVARDYLVFRFVVAGLPRRARAVAAAHVTICSRGKRLVLPDSRLLRAVYNREELPYFCLDGLNCPSR